MALSATASSAHADCAAAAMPVIFHNALLTVGVWSRGTDAAPACLGANPPPTLVLVETRAKFTEPGGEPALLARFAALRDYKTIRYWSVTRQRWRPLVNAVARVDATDRKVEGNFSPQELRPGSSLEFWQDENTPAGSATYGLIVERADATDLAVALSNTKPITFLGFTMFAPGEYRFHHAFHHLSGTTWEYRGRIQILGDVDFPFGDRAPSYANRAEAIFRYLAGLSPAAAMPVAP